MKFHCKKKMMAGLTMMGLSMLPAVQTKAQPEVYDPSVFVKTEINSGNPAFPFPQFLEYKGGGKSLAKYSAEGVTHADMEKAMREAYVMMTHRCRYVDDVVGGVRYMTYNKDVPQNFGIFSSEGDGYALLAAAMFADQPTFNGLYMWIHDNRFSGVKRFKDGKVLRADQSGFAGPYIPGWDCDEETDNINRSHSASDASNDIAMAMLIAYKQWGEWMKQDGEVVKDSEGNPISLKSEAQHVIGALVDTIPDMDKQSGIMSGYLSGIIGIDGYTKSGNSWGELTQWRFSEDAKKYYPGVNGLFDMGPILFGVNGQSYIDYDAPAYYTEFAKWLENGDGEGTKWQISQFKRAAASANWLNQQAYDQGLQASIGKVQMSEDDSPVFKPYVDLEDFRYPWRHMMDYLWHGNASCDWDPKTHQVIEGTNNSEYLMGMRHAELLKNPTDGGKEICSYANMAIPSNLWSGVAQIPQQWNLDGTISSEFHTNFSIGAGSPAAVISGDEELLGDIYRQCEIKWNGTNSSIDDPEERYEGSTPAYFHDWFRTLGMLVTSGNLTAPSEMKSAANVKVYMSVDKTVAYPGESVTYDVCYRNYGSANAKGAVITTKLDPVYKVTSVNGGGKYDEASNTITWNVGEIPGFKSGNLNATMDSVSFTVTATDVKGNVRVVSTIKGDNFDEWESNEYPNHATYTMERNLVDVIDKPVKLIKSADVTEVAVNDTIEYTLTVANKSAILSGGRSEVNFTAATFDRSKKCVFFRVFNDASEAYINLGNYRVSYFLYDTTGVIGQDSKSVVELDNEVELTKYKYDENILIYGQKIAEGQDEKGRWNQRMIVNMSNSLMAPTSHIEESLGIENFVHKGGLSSYFIRLSMPNPYDPYAVDKDDFVDWSYSKDIEIDRIDGSYDKFTLVGPKWDGNGETYFVNNYARNICSNDVDVNFDRVLVEEFDGYAWRRIAGNAPEGIGEAIEDVLIVDSIAEGLELVEFSSQPECKYEIFNNKLYIRTPTIYDGKNLSIKYRCVVKSASESGIFGSFAVMTSNMSDAVSEIVNVNVLQTNVNELKAENNELVDVYNANGVLLKKQISRQNALNGLPYGVYVVNGEKMVKSQK